MLSLLPSATLWAETGGKKRDLPSRVAGSFTIGVISGHPVALGFPVAGTGIRLGVLLGFLL